MALDWELSNFQAIQVVLVFKSLVERAFRGLAGKTLYKDYLCGETTEELSLTIFGHNNYLMILIY